MVTPWARAAFLAAAAVHISTAACVTDHEALALRERDPDGQEAGASGVSDGTTTPAEVGAPPESSARREASIDEDLPEGPSSLSLVHGVVDERGGIAFCFAGMKGSDEQPSAGVPLPRGGLGYGETWVLDSLEGIDLDHDGVRPYVLAGDLSHIAGLDCRDAVDRARALMARAVADAGPESGGDPDAGAIRDAGGSDDSTTKDAARTPDADGAPDPPPPPPIRVRALAALPAGTLAEPRSFLLIAAGCLGGPSFVDPRQQDVCGELYTETSPTLTPILVSLSRSPTGDVGLQFVNGVAAFGSANLVTVPSNGDSVSPYTIASSVSFGELAPTTPRRRAAAVLAADHPEARLDIRTPSGSRAIFTQSWSDTLALGRLDAPSDGRNYTLVLLGPHPNLDASSWWNGSTLTILDNDPLGAPRDE